MCKISDHRIKVNLFKWKLTLGWITLLLQMTSVAIGPELSSLISRWIFARFLEMVSNCSGDKSWLSFRENNASLMLSIHWNWGCISCAQSKLHTRAMLPDSPFKTQSWSSHRKQDLVAQECFISDSVNSFSSFLLMIKGIGHWISRDSLLPHMLVLYCCWSWSSPTAAGHRGGNFGEWFCLSILNESSDNICKHTSHQLGRKSFNIKRNCRGNRGFCTTGSIELIRGFSEKMHCRFWWNYIQCRDSSTS